MVSRYGALRLPTHLAPSSRAHVVMVLTRGVGPVWVYGLAFVLTLAGADGGVGPVLVLC